MDRLRFFILFIFVVALYMHHDLVKFYDASHEYSGLHIDVLILCSGLYINQDNIIMLCILRLSLSYIYGSYFLLPISVVMFLNQPCLWIVLDPNVHF